MPEPTFGNISAARRKAGFFLEPLGWVQDRLGKAIEIDPTLVGPLIEVDQSRMHLVALALAHLTCEINIELARLLLQGPRKDILCQSVGYHPIGLARILRRLPPKVLATETYCSLVNLLNDTAAAKFLHHSDSIKATTIVGLHSLPAILRRPAIMIMVDRIDGMDKFVDGLRLLGARSGLPFDSLAIEIGSLNQPYQIVAKLRHLIHSLPLPEALPPPEIGGFRRLDSVAEIRNLAKNWENCLAECLYRINDGTAAVYLSEEWKVVCFVSRHSRMGWFLLQAKGPKNADIDPHLLAQIQATFSAAGIPDSSMIEPIKGILLTHEWSRRRQAQDQDEIFDDVPIY